VQRVYSKKFFLNIDIIIEFLMMVSDFFEQPVISRPLATKFFFFFFFFLWVREVALRPTHKQASVDRCPIIWHDLFSRTLPTITRRNLV